jgi:AraC-like DNA-binding protein
LNESAIISAMAPVAQTVRDLLPAAGLEQHVSCVWVQEVAPGSAPFVHRRAPTGGAELICTLGAAPRVLGPQTGPTAEVLGPGTTIVGVRLRPEAASAVLGLPATELVDQEVELDELQRGAGERIGEVLAAAPSPEVAARRLEAVVPARSSPDPVVAEAVRHLLSDRRPELFISERQLRRRFEAAAGLTPKTLQRILRFQRFLALAWLSERPSAELARLAADAGYADQAHLTREAARLEGRPPGVFLVESEQRCNCGHDHSASYGPLL